MLLQVEALFVHDQEGFITFENEPYDEKRRAPRFFLGCTSEGNVVRFRDDIPSGTRDRLSDLVDSLPDLPDGRLGPTTVASIEEILLVDGPISNVWAGPAFVFPDGLPDTPHPDSVLVERQNSDLLRPGFSDAIPGIGRTQPCVAFVEGGTAVSLCQTVRESDRAAEAGLDTLEGSRGRGFAPLIVPTWARRIGEAGKTPIYSTSWKNTASRRVAEKLNLIQFGVDHHFT